MQIKVQLVDVKRTDRVEVWYRPQLLNVRGGLVWSADVLVADGLVARALAHEVLASGLVSGKVAA
jgi:hypothetical protein